MQRITQSSLQSYTSLLQSSARTPSQPNPLRASPGWSSHQKETFFHSLRTHSRLRPDLIALSCNQPIDSVVAYLRLLAGLAPSRPARWTRALTPAAEVMTDLWIAHEERLARRVEMLDPQSLPMDVKLSGAGGMMTNVVRADAALDAARTTLAQMRAPPEIPEARGVLQTQVKAAHRHAQAAFIDLFTDDFLLLFTRDVRGKTVMSHFEQNLRENGANDLDVLRRLRLLLIAWLAGKIEQCLLLAVAQLQRGDSVDVCVTEAHVNFALRDRFPAAGSAAAADANVLQILQDEVATGKSFRRSKRKRSKLQLSESAIDRNDALSSRAYDQAMWGKIGTKPPTEAEIQAGQVSALALDKMNPRLITRRVKSKSATEGEPARDGLDVDASSSKADETQNVPDQSIKDEKEQTENESIGDFDDLDHYMDTSEDDLEWAPRKDDQHEGLRFELSQAIVSDSSDEG